MDDAFDGIGVLFIEWVGDKAGDLYRFLKRRQHLLKQRVMDIAFPHFLHKAAWHFEGKLTDLTIKAIYRQI